MSKFVPVLAASARIAVGAVLVVAAASKYLSYDPSPVDHTFGLQAFASLIARQGVVPEGWAMTAAVAVFVVEIAVGAWLFTHLGARAAAACAAGLLVAFSAYLCAVYVRGQDINCGCFGTVTKGGLATALVRNAGLVALATFGAWCVGSRAGVRCDRSDGKVVRV